MKLSQNVMLKDNCFIKIYQFQQNGTRNGHEFILLTCRVCDNLVKLHGLEFHGRKSITEEAKTPLRPLAYNFSTNTVANDYLACIKVFLL